MSLLFILFKTLDYFQQFLQERLAHKALGLLQVAHSSERVRERDEQCAQVARICVVQAQRVIELFGKKVNNALNVH